MRFSDIIFPLSLAIATVSASVIDRRLASTLQNGRGDAQKLYEQLQGPTASSKCMDGETTWVSDQLAQCAGDKFVVNEEGTSVTRHVQYPARYRVIADLCPGCPYKREIEDHEAAKYVTKPSAAKAPPAYRGKAKRVDTSADNAPTTDSTDPPSLPIENAGESLHGDRSPHIIRPSSWRRRPSVTSPNAYVEQPRDVNNAVPFSERAPRNEEEARGKTVGYEWYRRAAFSATPFWERASRNEEARGKTVGYEWY